MRIRRLFSSVLAGLALMYASGCNNTCQQVAGYNVYGNPYATPDTQAMAYNAAYNPGYNQGGFPVQAPAAVTYDYPQAAVRPTRVKRTKTRYERPAKQRFTQQITPYTYNQSYVQPYAGQTVAPATYTNVAAAPVSWNVVPTITTNTDGVPGLTTAGVAHDPYGYGNAYVQQPTYLQQPMAQTPAPVQVQAPVYNYGVPAGSNVQCQTAYRRGKPTRQRFRKVRWQPIQAPQPVVQPVAYQPPIQPLPVTIPEPAPIVMEPYVPPIDPIPYTPPAEPIPYTPPVDPVPAPEPEPEPQVVRQEINTIINPVIEPRIQPVIDPIIEPHIKPLIEPTIRTRIEPTPPVEQPVQQPIVQPVIIQPIIQPVIQAPIQSVMAAEVQAPVQMAIPDPVYQPQPVYMTPPPPLPAPVFPEPVMGTGYCPPDVCPVPNPVVCQPGQNLSECFTLNDYQVMNTPAQIYTPTASGPLSVGYGAMSGGSNDGGTATWVSSPNAGIAPLQTGAQTQQMGQPQMTTQVATSKYEALPMPEGTASFGAPQFNGQMNVPAPFGQTENIPPVPAATEIENALDAMLSRDQWNPNLK